MSDTVLYDRSKYYKETIDANNDAICRHIQMPLGVIRDLTTAEGSMLQSLSDLTNQYPGETGPVASLKKIINAQVVKMKRYNEHRASASALI